MLPRVKTHSNNSFVNIWLCSVPVIFYLRQTCEAVEVSVYLTRWSRDSWRSPGTRHIDSSGGTHICFQIAQTRIPQKWTICKLKRELKKRRLSWSVRKNLLCWQLEGITIIWGCKYIGQLVIKNVKVITSYWQLIWFE